MKKQKSILAQFQFQYTDQGSNPGAYRFKIVNEAYHIEAKTAPKLKSGALVRLVQDDARNWSITEVLPENSILIEDAAKVLTISNMGHDMRHCCGSSRYMTFDKKGLWRPKSSGEISQGWNDYMNYIAGDVPDQDPDKWVAPELKSWIKSFKKKEKFALGVITKEYKLNLVYK